MANQAPTPIHTNADMQMLEQQRLIAQLAIRVAHLEAAQRYSQSIPRTGLLSRNLFARAFSVWGHFLVAQLIISAVLSAAIAGLVFVSLIWNSLP